MLAGLILVLIALLVEEAGALRVGGRGLQRAGWHRPHTVLQAVNNPSKLAELQGEFAALGTDTESARHKELSTVMRCVDALRQLEADLAMMEEHLAGNDDSLKETARFFSKEFEQCKAEIEGQLNSILDGDDGPSRR